MKTARDKIVLPARLGPGSATVAMAPRDLERAFIEANPGLRPGMLAVTCVRGMLQEVRVCLSKDLRSFTACPDVVRSGCRAQEVSAPTR